MMRIPMRRTRVSVVGLLAILGIAGGNLAATAADSELVLISRKADPYGIPRPGRDEQHVPLQTSLYFELGLSPSGTKDRIVPESVEVRLQSETGPARRLLSAGRFAGGGSGRLFPGKGQGGEGTLAVYLEPGGRMEPSTVYTVQVHANSESGVQLHPRKGTWQFTTEGAGDAHPIRFELSLDAPPVRWQGGFFTGFCKPSFCTSATNRIKTYELMQDVRKDSPRAWVWQRDFWMTGFDHQPSLVAPNLPNIVRERETRRITVIEPQESGTLLHVEDFFGHEQYGIEPNRPLSADYQIGDEVLVADGVHDARAKVIAVHDGRRTLLVSDVAAPTEGWKIDYTAPLPEKESPDAPGLFARGGCYLRKFSPVGTPVYYWGRLDREWDLAHGRFGHRLMPNFADAPGDLSIDGRNWTTAKDYAQLHKVVHAMTSHLIERYGEECLEWRWSVFNEPDLQAAFWRADWTELQQFYDYTVDGILRAFEDHGYDSGRVEVGGLELGGIFGTNLRLREFLAHCSPRAEDEGAVSLNTAYADSRLEGRRSRRVEALCAANEGRGSPCDFVSIHAYNASKLMAEKLIRAKQMALEIDPQFYAELWVNSHESCPDWSGPADPAWGDSYLGNGYFPTWCADVARRQLAQADKDARYGFGDSILTFWPWPNPAFGGGNDCVRLVPVDDNGDGRADRSVTIAMPILHFLGLMARMGNEYQVLPERAIGGHVVSGFASQDGERTYVLVYAHAALDTQSRSEAEFDVTLAVSGIGAENVNLREYRFDTDHNSYFELGRRLRDKSLRLPSPQETAQITGAVERLRDGDRHSRLAALGELAELGPAAASALAEVVGVAQTASDPELQSAAGEAITRLWAPRAYPAQLVRDIEAASGLQCTGSAEQRTSKGSVELRLSLVANGADFLILEQRKGKPKESLP